jgi:hypothetical protein
VTVGSSGSPPVPPNAPPPLSADGMWWWNGQQWQPTELHLRRLYGQTSVQAQRASKRGTPLAAGLTGCLGAVLLVIGGGAAVLEANNQSTCSSGVGQLAQAFSQNASQQCGVVSIIFYGGILLAVVGGITLLGALIIGLARR